MRHPAQVTADRLTRHVARWPSAFGDDDRQKIAAICDRLRTIAEDEFAYPGTGRYRGDV